MPVSAHMERFLALTFLVVRWDEVQVTECWCPHEVVKQDFMALGCPIEGGFDGLFLGKQPRSIIKQIETLLSKMNKKLCIQLWRKQSSGDIYHTAPPWRT